MVTSYQKRIGIKVIKKNQDRVGKNLSNNKSLEVHIAISQKNIKLHNFWQSTRNTWCIIELYEKYSSKLFYCSNQHFYHYWFLTSKVIEVESMKSYSIFTAPRWTRYFCAAKWCMEEIIPAHFSFSIYVGNWEGVRRQKFGQIADGQFWKNCRNGGGEGRGVKNPENCRRRLWMVP